MIQSSLSIRVIAAVGLLAALAPQAFAQTQIEVPVQGVLTDANGAPLQATVAMTFSIYANATATAPLWTELQTVEVGSVFPGVYVVSLGAVTQLNAELFRDNSNAHFAMRVGNDPADIGRWPLGSTPKSAHSELASAGGSGNTAQNDQRYVNVSGDTMVGSLVLPQGGLRVGTTSLVVDSQGRVGIGTATPNHGFEVVGRTTRFDARAAAGLRLDLAGTGDFVIRETGTTDLVQIGTIVNNISNNAVGINRLNPSTTADTRLDVGGAIASNGNAMLHTDVGASLMSVGDVYSGDGSIANLDLRTSNQTRVRIISSGNVGIGTTSPASPLHVYSAVSSEIRLGRAGVPSAQAFWRYNTGAVEFGPPAGDALHIYGHAGGVGLAVTSNDYVGVGTTSPAQRLHVAGNVRASGFCIDGDCRTSWGAIIGGREWMRQGTNTLLTNATDRVGIGTASPASPLHVYNVTNSEIRLGRAGNPNVQAFWRYNGTAVEFGPPAGDALHIHGPAGGVGLAVTSNDYVGVGTTSPDQRLTVGGHVRVGIEDNPVPAGGTAQAAGWGNALIFSGGPDVWAESWGRDNSDPLWMARYNPGPDQSELRMVIGDDGQAADRFVIGSMQGQGSGTFSQSENWFPHFTVQANNRVGVGTTNPQAALDVFGGIKVGNDEGACDSARAGAIRWAGSSGFQGCNGTSWVSLDHDPPTCGAGEVLNTATNACETAACPVDQYRATDGGDCVAVPVAFTGNCFQSGLCAWLGANNFNGDGASYDTSAHRPASASECSAAGQGGNWSAGSSLASRAVLYYSFHPSQTWWQRDEFGRMCD